MTPGWIMILAGAVPKVRHLAHAQAHACVLW